MVRWIGGNGAGRPGVTVRQPWGEGLVEQSLSTRLYGATWSDVDPDELVWLDPALVKMHTPARRTVLRALLLQAVERQLSGLEACETAGLVMGPAAGLDVARRLSRTGLFSALTLDGLGAREPRVPRTGLFGHAGIDAAGARSKLVAGLSIVACLDAAVRRLAAPVAGGLGDPTATDADALVVAVAAGFNAAYLDEEHDIAHELLEVGAWLGQLARGRPAWLQSGLAARLIDELADGRVDVVDRTACGRIVRETVAATVGVDRLMSIARRVARTGVPSIVRPNGGSTKHWLSWLPWNDALHATVAACLGGCVPASPS